jgi:hypothetical protein
MATTAAAAAAVAQVDCTLAGGDDWPEAGTRCTFLVPHPVSARVIDKLFPFEGRFHYRVKISGDLIGISERFVWVDLQRGDEREIPFVASSSTIEIQALILELPQEYTDDSDYKDYLETCNQELGLNPLERPHRGQIEDGTSSKSLLKKLTKGVKKRTVAVAESIGVAVPVSVSSVAHGAASIWNKFVSKASEISSSIAHGAANGGGTSDEADENLADLAADVSSGYNDSVPRHAQLLRDLWEAHQFGPNFERVSDKWKEAGWQKPDPIADLKASGVLALRAMSYFGQKYPEKSQSMLHRNKANIKTNYPYAVVGVNITLLLAELLNLRDNK